jgi:VCBS repeat-containing protein
MPYFRELPEIDYLSFLPDRQKSDEYVRVKNLFRRAKLRDDIINPLIVFDKYIIPDGYRPDNVAEELYGSSQYDWVVTISAGLTNIRDEWPLSDNDVYRYAFKKYGDNLYGTHHYETVEQKDSGGRIILDGKKTVSNVMQIPYPSSGVELGENELIVGIDPVLQTLSGNLYVHDTNTIKTTEQYGVFNFSIDNESQSGGSWVYTLAAESIESDLVYDSISFLSKDGYTKNIKIYIETDNDEPYISSYKLDSSQQSYITFYDNKTESTVTRTNIIRRITNYSNEILINNAKREINVLKPRYLQEFIRDMRSIMKYKKSSQSFLDANGNRIIKTENVRNYDTYGRTFIRPNPTEVIVNELA